MRLAGNETGNGNDGKSNGNNDKVVGQATASNGEGGRQLMATRAIGMVTVNMWVMAAVPTTSMCRQFGQSHMWLVCTSYLPYPEYDVNRLILYYTVR